MDLDNYQKPACKVKNSGRKISFPTPAPQHETSNSEQRENEKAPETLNDTPDEAATEQLQQPKPSTTETIHEPAIVEQAFLRQAHSPSVVEPPAAPAAFVEPSEPVVEQQPTTFITLSATFLRSQDFFQK